MSDIETKPDVREGIVQTSLPAEEVARLSDDIIAALKTVYDPEIPADIFELGLIYKVDFKDDRSVDVMMTLTTPNCPAAGELPIMVESLSIWKRLAAEMGEGLGFQQTGVLYLAKTDREMAGFDAWTDQVYAEEQRAAEKLDARLKLEEHWLQRGVTGRRKRNQGRLTKLYEMRAERAAITGIGASPLRP